MHHRRNSQDNQTPRLRVFHKDRISGQERASGIYKQKAHYEFLKEPETSLADADLLLSSPRYREPGPFMQRVIKARTRAQKRSSRARVHNHNPFSRFSL